MKATICRKIHFNSAHRLHNPNWGNQKNSEVFGKCNNANYHGHNYNLEVKVQGNINKETGYVLDTKILNGILEKEVIEKFDHKNLNLDTTEFKNLNPTAENIAVIIYNAIKPKLNRKHELTIILHETERNYVEYSGN
jgi:6-pyruvoyltetrahydropterin/6-carboxytetrahydropterin synthase